MLALLANVHRDPKKSQPAKPADFNPFSSQKSFRTEKLSDLKSFFVSDGDANDQASPLDFSVAGTDDVCTDQCLAQQESQARGSYSG